MLKPKEDEEGSPVLRPVVRRPVAVAAPPHQLAPLVHLAKGSTHCKHHIEHEQEEERQVFHHHLHLLLLRSVHKITPSLIRLHSVGPPMGHLGLCLLSFHFFPQLRFLYQ